MNEAPITNRVAQSALVTFDLEDFWPKGGVLRLALSDLAPQGLVREVDARAYVQNLEKHTYEGSVVCLEGAGDVIVPQWLGPMLASALASHAAFVGFGAPNEVLSAYYAQALAEADWTPYRGAKVLLKGCGTHPVPDSAYAAAALHLTRMADKLMYGEACSNVPIFKAAGS
ncbi:MAG: DUF2480 family protein [Bacteroidetes bacterium]|nr:DUF2480 family protein [Bacteroidota bacterium]